MRRDHLGQYILNDYDLIDLVMRAPDRISGTVLVEPTVNTKNTLDQDSWPRLKHYEPTDMSAAEFDQWCQQQWLMPQRYKNMNIAEYVLDQCKTQAELQRAGEELLLYQQLDAMQLLRYLKYLVDTMRRHGVVWGVGRGSSVASYVLYLLGVHKIDSLYYGLDIKEFLKV